MEFSDWYNFNTVSGEIMENCNNVMPRSYEICDTVLMRCTEYPDLYKVVNETQKLEYSWPMIIDTLFSFIAFRLKDTSDAINKYLRDVDFLTKFKPSCMSTDTWSEFLAHEMNWKIMFRDFFRQDNYEHRILSANMYYKYLMASTKTVGSITYIGSKPARDYLYEHLVQAIPASEEQIQYLVRDATAGRHRNKMYAPLRSFNSSTFNVPKFVGQLDMLTQYSVRDSFGSNNMIADLICGSPVFVSSNVKDVRLEIDKSHETLNRAIYGHPEIAVIPEFLIIDKNENIVYKHYEVKEVCPGSLRKILLQKLKKFPETIALVPAYVYDTPEFWGYPSKYCRETCCAKTCKRPCYEITDVYTPNKRYRDGFLSSFGYSNFMEMWPGCEKMLKKLYSLQEPIANDTWNDKIDLYNNFSIDNLCDMVASEYYIYVIYKANMINMLWGKELKKYGLLADA